LFLFLFWGNTTGETGVRRKEIGEYKFENLKMKYKGGEYKL